MFPLPVFHKKGPPSTLPVINTHQMWILDPLRAWVFNMNMYINWNSMQCINNIDGMYAFLAWRRKSITQWELFSFVFPLKHHQPFRLPESPWILLLVRGCDWCFFQINPRVKGEWNLHCFVCQTEMIVPLL